MADLHQGTDRNFVHIQDCRVWAEINYLDSPTDYREYLPQGALQFGGKRSHFVMLDDLNHVSSACWARVPIFSVGLICILIAGYFCMRL
jgi:hypothetical protein